MRRVIVAAAATSSSRHSVGIASAGQTTGAPDDGMTATGWPSASDAERATPSIPSPATIAKGAGWEAPVCASQPSGRFVLAESARDIHAVVGAGSPAPVAIPGIPPGYPSDGTSDG